MDGILFFIVLIIVSSVIKYFNSLQEKGRSGSGSPPAEKKNRIPGEAETSGGMRAEAEDLLRRRQSRLRDVLQDNMDDGAEAAGSIAAGTESEPQKEPVKTDERKKTDIAKNAATDVFIKEPQQNVTDKKIIPDFKSTRGIARGFIYSEVLGPPVSKRR